MGESLRHRTAHGHPLMGINSYSQSTEIYREVARLRARLAAIELIIDTVETFELEDGAMVSCGEIVMSHGWVRYEVLDRIQDALYHDPEAAGSI